MSLDDPVSFASSGSVPTLLCRAAEAVAPGRELDLDADEVAHVRALRLREGDDVELTDGRGGRWRARMTAVDRRRAVCAVLEPLPVVEPWPVELWAPVGQRERSLWLVEKATEIGISVIRLVEWARSRSVGDAGRSDGFVARAVRRAESALKQSGGSRLPRIERPVDLASRLADGNGGRRLLADPSGPPLGSVLDESPSEAVIFLVGPEGGATEEELDLCRGAGFEPVGLGPRTLRFETAAIVGLAGIAAALEARTEDSADSAASAAGDPNTVRPR